MEVFQRYCCTEELSGNVFIPHRFSGSPIGLENSYRDTNPKKCMSMDLVHLLALSNNTSSSQMNAIKEDFLNVIQEEKKTLSPAHEYSLSVLAPVPT